MNLINCYFCNGQLSRSTIDGYGWSGWGNYIERCFHCEKKNDYKEVITSSYLQFVHVDINNEYRFWISFNTNSHGIANIENYMTNKLIIRLNYIPNIPVENIKQYVDKLLNLKAFL